MMIFSTPSDITLSASQCERVGRAGAKDDAYGSGRGAHG